VGYAVAAEFVRRHLCLTEVLRYPRSACGSRAQPPSTAYPRSASVCHLTLRSRLEEPAPPASEAIDDRLVVLGDDADGNELEVMAVEGPKGELIAIHAMELREKYRAQYEEAKQWRL
jgi:hypothetical protein